MDFFEKRQKHYVFFERTYSYTYFDVVAVEILIDARYLLEWFVGRSEYSLDKLAHSSLRREGNT